jgi:ribosomal protein L29
LFFCLGVTQLDSKFGFGNLFILPNGFRAEPTKGPSSYLLSLGCIVDQEVTIKGFPFRVLVGARKLTKRKRKRYDTSMKKQRVTIAHVAEDLANLETKVDEIGETVNKTQEDIQEIKNLVTLLPTKEDLHVKDDLARIKTVLREKLQVKI